MFIYTPAKINDNFYLLRAPDFCIYLFLGDEGAILETGISQIIPEVLKNIDSFQIERSKIKYIIILHSHYDHSGGVTELLRAFPSAKVLGSAETAKIMKDDSQIELIKKGLEKSNQNPLYKDLMDKGARVLIEKTEVETVLDEEEIDLGKGIRLRFLKTPGHSPCALSVYEKSNKILLISDNCGSIYPSSEKNEDVLSEVGNLQDQGIQFSGLKVWSVPFYNYSLYLKNFDRLKSFDFNSLGFGHIGLWQGKETKKFFDFSKKQAEKLKEIMEQRFEELKDKELVLKSIMEKEFKELLYYFPPFVVKWGTRAMMKSIGIK